jgi:PAS domain-containing protein
MPQSAPNATSTKSGIPGQRLTLASLFRDPETVGLFLDQFPNGVLITDPEGHVIFINKPYSRFL